MSSRLFPRLFSFGCNHKFGWPRQSEDGKYYQVCTGCGCEFEYDWEGMQRLGPRSPQPAKKPATGTRSSHRSWRPRARRFEYSTPIRFRPTGDSDWTDGTIINISKTGILLSSAAPAQLACELEMVFVVPEEISSQPETIAFAHGRVVRASGKDEAFTAAVMVEELSYPEPNAKA